MTADRRGVFAIGLLSGMAFTLLAGYMLFVVLPTGPLLLGGVGDSGFNQFGAKVMLDSVSPGGRQRVSVTKAIHFPPNEWLDPAIRVDVSLVDAQAGNRLDWVVFFLWEDSDFGSPKARWAPDGWVIISDLDDHSNLSVTLRAREKE